MVRNGSAIRDGGRVCCPERAEYDSLGQRHRCSTQVAIRATGTPCLAQRNGRDMHSSPGRANEGLRQRWPVPHGAADLPSKARPRRAGFVRPTGRESKIARSQGLKALATCARPPRAKNTRNHDALGTPSEREVPGNIGDSKTVNMFTAEVGRPDTRVMSGAHRCGGHGPPYDH